MEHYSKVFNCLTLGHCTIKELCKLADLNQKTVEYLLHNLEQNQIITKVKEYYQLNCCDQWLLHNTQLVSCNRRRPK